MRLSLSLRQALPDQDKLPYNDVPVIAKLRSYSRMLRRKAKKAPKVADERAKLVAWPDVVKVLLKVGFSGV